MNTDTELLRKLVAEWRKQASRYYPTAESMKDAYPMSTKEGEAWAMRSCADELDEALSRLLSAQEGWDSEDISSAIEAAIEDYGPLFAGGEESLRTILINRFAKFSTAPNHPPSEGEQHE